MKAFLAIKYYDDMKNKDKIEKICKTLKKMGIETFAFARNIQNYKKCTLTPDQIMNLAFKNIKSSDIFIIDASEVSIGIGIEAGYAYTHNIPIYVIADKNSEVSNSIKGIAKKFFTYIEPCDILNLNF